MSIHIPWAEEAQLTEVSTATNFVGTLRECMRLYSAMPAAARINVLILSDASVPLPGRSPTKVLEHSELEALISVFDVHQIEAPDIADLLRERCAL